jgi:hypothetical protein
MGMTSKNVSVDRRNHQKKEGIPQKKILIRGREESSDTD